MINIEDIEEVSRLAIQARSKTDEDVWFTVTNLPIGTKIREGQLELDKWKNDEPDSTFRLIRADIIVDIKTISVLYN
jgi:Flp pilus assembly protein CpaB